MASTAPWMGVAEEAILPKPENLPRWYGRRGWYEVWYATTNHRPSRTGLWFRYTLHAPPSGAAEVSVWGFAFRPDGPIFAAKRTYPLGEAGVDAEHRIVFTPDATLTEDRLQGSLTDDRGRELRWGLRFDPSGEATSPLPPIFERAAPAYYCNPNLDVPASGTISVDGEELALEHEPLGQSHISGRHHAGAWAWAHLHVANGFVVEALQVRPHAPGAGRLPALPFALVELAGCRERFGSSPRRRLRGRIAFPAWYLVAERGDLRLHLTVQAPPHRFVQVTYTDPDGGEAFCTNTEVADAAIEVQRRHAGGWRTTETHRLDGTAHLEFGARSPIPEVPVAL